MDQSDNSHAELSDPIPIKSSIEIERVNLPEGDLQKGNSVHKIEGCPQKQNRKLSKSNNFERQNIFIIISSESEQFVQPGDMNPKSSEEAGSGKSQILTVLQRKEEPNPFLSPKPMKTEGNELKSSESEEIGKANQHPSSIKASSKQNRIKQEKVHDALKIRKQIIESTSYFKCKNVISLTNEQLVLLYEEASQIVMKNQSVIKCKGNEERRKFQAYLSSEPCRNGEDESAKRDRLKKQRKKQRKQQFRKREGQNKKNLIEKIIELSNEKHKQANEQESEDSLCESNPHRSPKVAEIKNQRKSQIEERDDKQLAQNAINSNGDEKGESLLRCILAIKSYFKKSASDQRVKLQGPATGDKQVRGEF